MVPLQRALRKIKRWTLLETSYKERCLTGSFLSDIDFQSYYQSVFGDRWSNLYQSLLRDEEKVSRFNRFARSVDPGSCFHQLEDCVPALSGAIPRNPEGLLEYYVMDPASVVAARALEVQAGDRVLDMCAAPGGKTLILAEELRENGELIANEISANRRENLKKVIQQYIPRDVRDRIWVTGKDGGQFALREKESFDRVLVDAPCSGERHLLMNKVEMEQWSLSRSKKLAQRQYALLTAALIVAKPGARIVYSTCAISPLENDEVIQRLLDKKGDSFRIFPNDLEYRRVSKEVLNLSEKTKFGRQFLPDKCGFGPIYFASLEKT